jgi:hypothetical protein
LNSLLLPLKAKLIRQLKLKINISRELLSWADLLPNIVCFLLIISYFCYSIMSQFDKNPDGLLAGIFSFGISLLLTWLLGLNKGIQKVVM